MLIDVFHLSEKYEADLLYTKLALGEGVVDRWCIINDSYSFQGEDKGCCVREILSQQRFEKYKNKIDFVETNTSPLDVLGRYNIESESDSLAMETAQREKVIPALRKYDDSDLVLLSDVDEFIFTNELNTIALQQAMQNASEHGSVSCLRRIRFQYEINNLFPCLRHTPMVSVRTALAFKKSIAYIRAYTLLNSTFNERLEINRSPLILEFSSFGDRKEIRRKYETFGHKAKKGWAVEAMLNLNISSLEFGTDPISAIFFEKINSPIWLPEKIKELSSLFSHPVSLNYTQNRIDNKLPPQKPYKSIPNIKNMIILHIKLLRDGIKLNNF